MKANRERKGRFGYPLSLGLLTIFYCGLACGPASAATGSEQEAHVARGPLRVLDSNPRYFTDGTGKAIYLTGSHNWNNLQDSGIEHITIFDYYTYLDRLQKYNHNLVRLWVRENAAWASWTNEKVVFDPLPYRRRGPGTALEGEGDLTAAKLLGARQTFQKPLDMKELLSAVRYDLAH